MNYRNIDDDREDNRAVASGSSGPPIKLILLLILTAGIGAFFFQNLGDATIEFLWMEGSFPVWAVILVSFLAGALFDRLASWQWSRARRRG